MSRRPLRRRTRRALGWTSLLLLAAVVAAAWSVTLAAPSGRSPDRPGGAAPHASTPTSSIPSPAASDPGASSTSGSQSVPAPGTMGIYVGPGALSSALSTDQQLSDRVRYALDFIPETSWATITDPGWLVSQWRGGPFRMVLAVPMLPESGGSLQTGANGTYDAEFTVLGQRLVQDGLGSAVLMIGWTPGALDVPWYVGSATAATEYVRYWDAIRRTMAAVPGADFTYEWVEGSDASPVNPASTYPGNAAVDLIGTTVFDRGDSSASGAARWTALLRQPDGPGWVAAFARSHGRQLSVAMWGVVPRQTGGGGDDAAFVRALLGWESAQHVRISVLWDYGTWAITGGAFPAAEAVLTGALTSSVSAGQTTGDVVGTTPAAEVDAWDAPQTGLGRPIRTVNRRRTGSVAGGGEPESGAWGTVDG